MGTRLKRQARQAAKESQGTVVFAGVVCLAVGLAIGFYLGRQSAAPAAPVQSGGALPNASSFAQDEASLKSILGANPKDLNALIQLANLYYDHGQSREAVEWYGKALELAPNNPNVRTDRGTSYWNLGQADAAIAEFEKSLQINPSHAQSLYNLGVVYLHGKNDPGEARKAWERLLATNPDYPDRAKVQQQIAGLSSPGTGADAPAGEPKAGTKSLEDLLGLMKKRQ